MKLIIWIETALDAEESSVEVGDETVSAPADVRRIETEERNTFPLDT